LQALPSTSRGPRTVVHIVSLSIVWIRQSRTDEHRIAYGWYRLCTSSERQMRQDAPHLLTTTQALAYHMLLRPSSRRISISQQPQSNLVRRTLWPAIRVLNSWIGRSPGVSDISEFADDSFLVNVVHIWCRAIDVICTSIMDRTL